MNEIKEKINVDEITKSCRIMDAKELLSLLKMSGAIMMSWGAHNFIVDSTTNTRMFRMNVQGHHHKGHVYIFVNGSDLFDVYLTSNRGTIKNKIEGLYNDQLVEWIDEKVEKISDYSF